MQELPPGKGFSLDLGQLRFVADLLLMADNGVDSAVHDRARLAGPQVKLFCGSKACGWLRRASNDRGGLGEGFECSSIFRWFETKALVAHNTCTS